MSLTVSGEHVAGTHTAVASRQLKFLAIGALKIEKLLQNMLEDELFLTNSAIPVA